MSALGTDKSRKSGKTIDSQSNGVAKKANRESSHKIKQNAWKQFAQGAAAQQSASLTKKKSGSKPSVLHFNRKSMFSTPDDPNARVGVIGSGKPMTRFQNRSKHLFSTNSS